MNKANSYTSYGSLGKPRSNLSNHFWRQCNALPLLIYCFLPLDTFARFVN